MNPTHPAASRENTRLGIAAGIAAYSIWGLVPIFFKQVAEVPATEIIAHRVVWAMLLMTLLLGFGRGFGDALRLARQPALLGRVALAAGLVVANWLAFVWGVNNGRIMETALGYFVLPLLNVALGVVVLHERMRPLQWVAIALAGVGVAIEATRATDLPWIALLLAGTFGIYGLMRKQLPLDAASGLFLETVCMTPPALAWLAWIAYGGEAHFGIGNGFSATDLLLVLTGPVTAVPLLLFAVAARRLPLSVMAFLQYFAPSISFLVALLVYHEPLDLRRLATFAAIWLGLAVYSADLVKAMSRPAPEAE